jgi:chitin synthase
MNITHQKYLVWLVLLAANVALIATFLSFENRWYVFLVILGLATLLNAWSAVLVLAHKAITSESESELATSSRQTARNYVYVVPCYNESKSELQGALDALVRQRVVPGDKCLLLVVCDGVVVGQNNTQSTADILLDIFALERHTYKYKYKNEKGETLCLYRGTYAGGQLPFVLCIKLKNRGKRDSLVLVRQECLKFNQHDDNQLNAWFFDEVFQDEKIDYIIGIDGDTVLGDECAYELIRAIEGDPAVHGCVGYVDVDLKGKKYSPFVWYQYAEYMFAQCLRRQAQARLTQKVSCLSGCNQILRVSEETCGEALLQRFNRVPGPEESIFDQIRGYASEDRNHVGLMLSMYPYVKTTQALRAVAHTEVPQSVRVFLSQRRRWNLGATCNDLLLTTLPHINFFERILAGVNVVTFALNPFIFVATIWFLKTLFTHPTLLMLYLSIIMLVPLLYIVAVPIFVRPLCFRDALYYYGGMLFFLLCGSIVNLITYTYSLAYMDEISWGKTRAIVSEEKITVVSDKSGKSRVIDVDVYLRESEV